MPKRKSTSELTDHLGYWLRFVSNHVSHAFKLKVEAKGVTVAEWVILRELLTLGPSNPSELADSVGMTRGAISKLVERLCQKDLIKRTLLTDDRRYQQIKLTPAGKSIVPTLAKLADENDKDFFGHLSASQRTEITTILQAIVRKAGWKEVPTN